jgi:hypothetical protein
MPALVLSARATSPAAAPTRPRAPARDLARAPPRHDRHRSRRSRVATVALAGRRPPSAAAASAAASDAAAPVKAWKGDVPPQSSLPTRADGSVDYSSIDASPISKVLIRTIRGLLVKEVGEDTDPRAWDDFDAVLTPVREVNDMKGTARDVTVRAKRVFAGILPALYIGWVPPIWKNAIRKVAPQWASNFAFVLVFTTLFPWLMGPMEGIDHVDVEVPEGLRKIFKFLPETVRVPQAIKAERCRFLEQSGCASVCVNSCKAPSQEWLGEDFGMDLHIQPNYDDFSCQWKFNVKPPPLYEDAAVMVPCFSKCPSEYKGEKDAFRQLARAKSGVGIVDGVDTYTGESLEAIARRAGGAARAARAPRGARGRDGVARRRGRVGRGRQRGHRGGVRRPRGDGEERGEVLERGRGAEVDGRPGLGLVVRGVTPRAAARGEKRREAPRASCS